MIDGLDAESRRIAARKKYDDEVLFTHKTQAFFEFSEALHYLSTISGDYMTYIYGDDLPSNFRPVLRRAAQGASWIVCCEKGNFVPSSSYLKQVEEADMATTIRWNEEAKEDFRRMQNGDDIRLPEEPHDLPDWEDDGWFYSDDD